MYSNVIGIDWYRMHVGSGTETTSSLEDTTKTDGNALQEMAATNQPVAIALDTEWMAQVAKEMIELQAEPWPIGGFGG